MDNYAQVRDNEDKEENQGQLGDLTSDEGQAKPRRSVRKSNKHNFLWTCVYIDKMTFTVNGKIYKTKKDYFLEMDPDKTAASANEFFRFCYHDETSIFQREISTKINKNVR